MCISYVCNTLNFVFRHRSYPQDICICANIPKSKTLLIPSISDKEYSKCNNKNTFQLETKEVKECKNNNLVFLSVGADFKVLGDVFVCIITDFKGLGHKIIHVHMGGPESIRIFQLIDFLFMNTKKKSSTIFWAGFFSSQLFKMLKAMMVAG